MQGFLSHAMQVKQMLSRCQRTTKTRDIIGAMRDFDSHLAKLATFIYHFKFNYHQLLTIINSSHQDYATPTPTPWQIHPVNA